MRERERERPAKVLWSQGEWWGRNWEAADDDEILSMKTGDESNSIGSFVVVVRWGGVVGRSLLIEDLKIWRALYMYIHTRNK